MKRIMRITVAVMVLTFMMTAAAFGATIKTEATGYLAPGSTVKVTVSIVGNQGFCAYGFQMDYNKDVYELVAFCPGEKSPAGTTSNISTGKIAYAASSNDTVHGDGVLFEALFKVKKGVSDGEYPIKAITDGIGVPATGAMMPPQDEPMNIQVSKDAPVVDESLSGEADKYEPAAEEKDSVTDDSKADGAGTNTVLYVGIAIVVAALAACIVALKRKKK